MEGRGGACVSTYFMGSLGWENLLCGWVYGFTAYCYLGIGWLVSFVVDRRGPSSRLSIRFVCLPIVGCSVRRGQVPIIQLLSVGGGARRPLTSLGMFLALRPRFTSISPMVMRGLTSNRVVAVAKLGLVLSPSFFVRRARHLSNAVILMISSRRGMFFRRGCPISVLTFSR